MDLLDPTSQDYSTRRPGSLFSYEGFDAERFVNLVDAFKEYILQLNADMPLTKDLMITTITRQMAHDAWDAMISDTPEIDEIVTDEVQYLLFEVPEKASEAADDYWIDHFQDANGNDPTLHMFLELLIWWVIEEVEDGDQPLEPFQLAIQMWSQYVWSRIPDPTHTYPAVRHTARVDPLEDGRFKVTLTCGHSLIQIPEMLEGVDLETVLVACGECPRTTDPFDFSG